MNNTINIFLYLLFSLSCYLFLTKKVLKKSIAQYYETAATRAGAYVFYFLFWPFILLYLITGYIYMMPTELVKNVERRREKFDK